MKRLTNYLMAMAAMVFTFTSCEDVPSPFGEPFMEKELVSYAQAGSGTTDDPYNVSKAMALIDAMGNGEVGAEVYIKGIITDISELSAQYGNATYVIADALDGKERITVFRGYLLGGEKVTVGNELSEGDQVIVKGKLQHYVSSAGAYTPEIAQGNQLYSLNGQVADEQPSSGDDDAKAVTIAEFNAAAESTSVWYKLTGTVKGFKDSDIYGNFDLVDATGSVYVYGLLSEKGGEKKLFQELAAAKGIKEGTKITIIGNRGSYGDKIEVLNAYFVSVDGEGSETPSGDGKGTAEAPYDVTSAIKAGSGTGVYVKGYIVGNVEGQVLADGAKFSATGDSQTNILIAASANETDVTKCMPVQLPSGAVRTALNLKDNPDNYKKEVTLYGNIEKYFGATGIKSVSFAILNGKEIGTNPGGGSTGGDDGIKSVTIAEFNAAADSNDVWYKLTGTVKNLKDGDQYGNFDLEDETGSVYVYGVLSEKGGTKKLFQELVSKYGIKEGSRITIIGNRGSYNGKIEVMNAYFVSIDNGGNSGGSGDSTTGADGSTVITIANFNAAESTSAWYQLTGTVKNLKDGDQYGNFDLEDSTGSVYVYGVLSEKGGAKKLFQELVSKHNIKNGTTITIVGNRGSYNGKIEVLNAYFISASN